MLRAISVVLVLVIILVIIAVVLLIFITQYRRSQPPEVPDNIDPSSLASVWSNSTEIGSCYGYQFPAPNNLTPGVVSFDTDRISLADQGPTLSCSWIDEQNSQLYSRTCQSLVCTGKTGQSYTQGQSEEYYDYCQDSITVCGGDLVVVVVDIEGAGLALSGANNSITTATVNLQDSNQYFIADYYNQYIVRLTQRSSSKVLVFNNDQLLLIDPSTTYNDGYVWLAIPRMEFTVSYFNVTSNYQVGYLGGLPSIIYDDTNNFSSEVNLRNFLQATSMLTLSYSNGQYSLAPWYYYDSNLNGDISINSDLAQTTRLVPVKELNRFVRLRNEVVPGL